MFFFSNIAFVVFEFCGAKDLQPQSFFGRDFFADR
jgi:hypothetical protein